VSEQEDDDLAMAWGLASRRRGAIRMLAIGAIALLAGLVACVGPLFSDEVTVRATIRLRIFGGVLATIGGILTAVAIALWIGARRATRQALTPDVPTAVARPRRP
jgi:hypothetical protein